MSEADKSSIVEVDLGALLEVDKAGELSMREKVMRLEAEMLKGDTVELEVKHYFMNGLYARELFIPKGVTLTGKIHRFEQINVVTKGEISVSTENGIERIKAPCVIVSPPGTKRVGYAHEDTVWITMHYTEETDLEKIEAHFIAKSFEELQLEAPEAVAQIEEV